VSAYVVGRALNRAGSPLIGFEYSSASKAAKFQRQDGKPRPERLLGMIERTAIGKPVADEKR
jgi:hypothetical protein